MPRSQSAELSDTAGDVIGVIYNQAEKTISYTKNGLYLGIAFHSVCEDRLFPTVRPGQPFFQHTLKLTWKNEVPFS